MDLTVTEAPTLTSIDVALAKANKRIRHASEDSLITFWLKVADDYIERRTNRALLDQQLTLRIPRILPVIQIPRPPLRSITSLKYTPTGGTEVTLNPATGIVLTKVDMLPTVTIPSLEDTPEGGADGTMTVVYRAGATSDAEVPPSLRQAALMLVGHYLTSREATFMDSRLMQVNKKIAFGVDELLKEYRVPNVNAKLNGEYEGA